MKSNKVINVTQNEAELLVVVIHKAIHDGSFGECGTQLAGIRNRLASLASPEANILARAADIVYNRGEEKERQYGPFETSLERTAQAFNLVTDRPGYLTSADIAMVMVQLKLTREGKAHREDNNLDAAAYLAAYNDIKEKE